MMLHELSEGYLQTAQLLANRVRALQKEMRKSKNKTTRERLHHEIAYLSGIMAQCRELAELTAHYYERDYYRNETYTL